MDDSAMSRSPPHRVATDEFFVKKSQTTFYQDVLDVLYSVSVVFDIYRYQEMPMAFREFVAAMGALIPAGDFQRAYAEYANSHHMQAAEYADPQNVFNWVYGLNIATARAIRQYPPTREEIDEIWSPSNFDKTTWAHPLWRVIHTATALMGTQPQTEELQAFEQFMVSLGSVIPCPKCSRHLKKKTVGNFLNDCYKGEITPLHWSIFVHNCVNRDTGRPIFPISKALELYGAPM